MPLLGRPFGSTSANPGPEVHFAWQGGEPTLMGLDFFRRIVELQKKYLPAGWVCTNALQTNGTLLTTEWCTFLRENRFLVGISIDGPAHLHDIYRLDKGQRPTHAKVMRGLRLLQEHRVEHNVLCVVNRANSEHPLEVYHFFKESGVQWIQFIPAVERVGEKGVTDRSVRPEQWGRFLTTIFDEWVRNDIGRIYVQTFEEAIRSEAGIPGGLCVFQETCGDALALEHNGDLYSCDHFVLPEYLLGNIERTPLPTSYHCPGRLPGEAKRPLPDIASNVKSCRSAMASVRRTASSRRPTASRDSTICAQGTAASSTMCGPTPGASSPCCRRDDLLRS